MNELPYHPLFPLGPDLTAYRLLDNSSRWISAAPFADTEILKIAAQGRLVDVRVA